MPGPRHWSQLTRSDWLSGSSSGRWRPLDARHTRAAIGARLRIAVVRHRQRERSGLADLCGCGGGGSTTLGAALGGSSKSTAVRLPRLAEIVLLVDLPDRPQRPVGLQRDAVGLHRPDQIASFGNVAGTLTLNANCWRRVSKNSGCPMSSPLKPLSGPTRMFSRSS